MGAAVVALGLAAALGLGCGGPERSWLRVAHRLVDLRADAAGVNRRPEASLADEARYVLRDYAEAPLGRAYNVPVPPDGTLRFRRPLPDALAGAERLAVVPQVRSGRSWHRLPGRVASVTRGPGGEFVPLAVELPAEAAGSNVEVSFQALIPRDGTQDRIDAPPVEIPPEARLEFGIGVLEAAAAQGPVAFSVQACAPGGCEPLFSEVLDPRAPEGGGWQDRAVSLAAQAGRTLSFRFETRLASAGGSFSLPVWSNPTVLAREPRPGDAFNVILLSVDTLRADHLPSYGYPRDTAPFVGELAREGTLFETLVAAAATTGPAHMSLFTSLQPSVHGVTAGIPVLAAGATTLAEALRGRGFTTGAVTEDGALNARQGFSRGFDSYAENKSADVLKPEGQVDATFARGRRWLAQHRDRRFFLFLHTFQVHHPYVPPARYDALFSQPIEGRTPHPYLPPDRDPALYDREIRYVDDELRDLFAALEREGLARDTLFVFTSDHGDEFLEHGFWGHGVNVYSEVTHVPLIFWGPGVPAGRRVAQAVAHVDVLPTLLELVGAPALPNAMGRSFAGLLRGTEPDAPGSAPPAFSEAWYPTGRTLGRRSIRVSQPTLAIRLGPRKLVRTRNGAGFAYEYYELDTDPGETRDLYAARPERALDLRRLIDAYPAQALALRAALREGGPGAAEEPEIDLSLDPERQEKLRALGYIE